MATLSEDDQVVLTLLALRGSDEEFLFLKEIKIFDFHVHNNVQRIALVQKCKELFSFTKGDPTTFWKTFTPSLTVSKFFRKQKRFPPVLYVGVGYKDKGSLRGSSFEPSPAPIDTIPNLWREVFFSYCLLFFHPLPVLESSTGIKFTRRRTRPADDPQRVKQ
jgi:hypothetical protein